MTNRRPPLLLRGLILGLALGASPVAAQDAFELPPIPVDTFTLDNGLRVIVSEDRSAPLAAVSMWYHVGSAHEPPGRSGFAHLFEHMLFEETEHLEDGEMDRLITGAGGFMNGTTDQDRTAYFEIVPSHRVNLALWMHAERMDRLRITERGFQTQRDVVKEERRLRVDNQPYGSARETLDTLATDYLPYRHSVIGSMADLDAADAEDAVEFYERWYVPNNAVLAVVGDVSTEQVRALVEEYFGAIPRGPSVPDLPPPPPAPRTGGERRVVLDDPMARLPMLQTAYTVPPAGHPDGYALALLSSILSGGESGRLDRRLVREERAALQAFARLETRRGPGVFLLGGVPNLGVDVERVERLIEEEVTRVKEAGVTERELRKAKNQRRAGTVSARLQVFHKSEMLQRAMLLHGDPFRADDELERFEAVTAEDVRDVARRYLTPENRTVVIARPVEEGR